MTLPALAYGKEGAADCSLPAGPWAEGSLGGPCGVGAGHPALAISAAGPVQAVPPAPTHYWAPQHRFPSRGAHRQRHDTQLPGLRPSGMALLCCAPGGWPGWAGGEGRARWSFTLLVIFQCKKPDLGMQKHFALLGGVVDAGWWRWQAATPRHIVMCQ